jgi:hypothetical protein
VSRNVAISLRAFAIWLLIIGVEIVHGAVRTLYLAPYVGDFQARQIGVFTGSVPIFAIAYVCVPWLRASTDAALLFVGLIWLLLTLAFEFTFGPWVLGRPWDDLLLDFKIWRGGFFVIGLLFLTLAPLLASRLRAHR